MKRYGALRVLINLQVIITGCEENVELVRFGSRCIEGVEGVGELLSGLVQFASTDRSLRKIRLFFRVGIFIYQLFRKLAAFLDIFSRLSSNRLYAMFVGTRSVSGLV